ncbi:hypothetical protein [Agrilutibacter solisilvae]|uniref:Uncharacterized protein n=1 Tax=Agrilutibacter solisilvae TaxID=2763317 RepID=A0A974XYJ5_9GAMM|nr:hypothetical protein [Lysobacter solisilvae]QSX78059.1 hypothetical protein I8J32_015325 [Lysobacter solisilvae]
MNPIKLHRTVRLGVIGGWHNDQPVSAIESAENEGWPADPPRGEVAEGLRPRHTLGAEPVEKVTLLCVQ